MGETGVETGVLTRWEVATLEAVAEVLHPPAGPVRPGAAEVGGAGQVDRWLAGMAPGPRRLVRAMLAGFALTPLLSRRPRPFHRLDPAERSAWIAATGTARLRPRRDALDGLRALVGLAYASDPRVAASIGYDGAPLVPVDRAALPPAVALPVREHPDVPASVDVDVVIVGSGAGGAVAADTLARAGFSVLVLEEGGAANRDDFTGRPADRMLSLYRDSGLTFAMGRPVISLPMGRVVGGTTVVNSGTCFRTPDDVLHRWSTAGLPGVTPDDMAPRFDEVEDVLGVQPVPEEVLGANGEALRRGAEALGLSGGPIRRNIRGCHGHGACAFGCPVDAKQAMHVTYLPRAVAAGAAIFAHVRARRVWTEDGRAVGVVAEVLDPADDTVRSELWVRARATVLAAGAVFTPTLLARQRLARSSGQLGRNLVIHPGAGTTARFPEELRAWRGTMQSYHVDEALDRGILLEATFPPPGIGYSAGSLPDAEGGGDLFGDYPRMASCGSIISDGGNGRVRPLGRRGSLIGYRLSREDTRKLVEGVALAAEIFLAAGADTVYPMLPGFPSITSPRDVERIRAARVDPSDLHLSAYHPMGTARMGDDPRRSVVDPWGAVWDVPGLSILDASILPSSTHVNPQITIMAMVARSAARLADRLA